jgi:hypothetical protein
MLGKLLIDIREWYIHIFKKKIIMIEKNKKCISNKFIIGIINFLYFSLVKDLLKYNEINIIYELDDLIFYDNNKTHTIRINQILLECNIFNPQDINDKKEITDKIKVYSMNMPFFVIVEIENININLNIQIKLMNMCKIITKEFEIKAILDKYLYELLV